jgi:hypothetical protein
MLSKCSVVAGGQSTSAVERRWTMAPKHGRATPSNAGGLAHNGKERGEPLQERAARTHRGEITRSLACAGTDSSVVRRPPGSNSFFQLSRSDLEKHNRERLGWAGQMADGAEL